MTITTFFNIAPQNTGAAYFSDQVSCTYPTRIQQIIGKDETSAQFLVTGDDTQGYRVLKSLESESQDTVVSVIERNISNLEDACSAAERYVHDAFHSWSSKGRNVKLEHGDAPDIPGFNWQHLEDKPATVDDDYAETFEEYMQDRNEHVPAHTLS